MKLKLTVIAEFETNQDNYPKIDGITIDPLEEEKEILLDIGAFEYLDSIMSGLGTITTAWLEEVKDA